jgi:protein phosphatase
MKLTIPELSLVLLVGVSGSGKSTFAHRHFQATEILSSDFFRGLVCDDPADQAASKDAFEVLHLAAAKRLAAGRLTVIDATNLQPEARKPLLDLARRYHCLPAAIVLDLPEELCLERAGQRPERRVPFQVVHLHHEQMRRALKALPREGVRFVHVLSTPEEVEAASIDRQPLWCNLRHEHGPFDFIGDVHGCFDELCALLQQLGYEIGVRTDTTGEAGYVIRPPHGRKAVFVGDLVDRGPNSPGVLRVVMDMVGDGTALCVLGNHDHKLRRKLAGREVQVANGLEETLAQLEPEPPKFKERVHHFLEHLISHYVLDGGRVVVAHAGLKEEMQGRASSAVRSFTLYGDTIGETDLDGFPVRRNWAAAYRGRALVIYGHTPIDQPQWLHGTLNIDTGCVFGGQLTALRYPEMELVSVLATQVYCEVGRPMRPPGRVSGLTQSECQAK